MANKQIPQLPLAISLDGSEQLEIVQGGTSKRTTVGAMTARAVGIDSESFLVQTSSTALLNERVVTDGAAAGKINFDWSVAGVVKAHLYASVANKLLYSTGADAWAETTLTSFARTLLDDTDAATALATLGAQASDADLTALAALSGTGMIARTGAGTAAVRTITGTASEITVTNGDGVSGAPTISLPTVNSNTGSFGSATQSLTLTLDAKGRVTAASAQTVTPAWGSITSTPTTVAGYGITNALVTTNNLSDVSSALTARSNLGVAIGSNVQAHDADLDALAALTGTNTIYYRSAADTWSAVTISANLGFSAGTLGSALGSAAVKNTGTSGNSVPLLDGANTFSAAQTVNLNAAAFPSGIGSATLSLLDVDSVSTRITVASVGGPAQIVQTRANGTAASPSALAADDVLGSNIFRGYDGSAWSGTCAVVRPYATQAWTTSAHGCDIRFATTSNDSTTLTDRCRVDHDGTFRPAADNTYSIGSASYRWSVVYAGTGTINTSDARDKTLLSAPPDAFFDAILSVPMTWYQWNAAIEAKGPDRARIHYGPTAQAVRDALLAAGFDPARYGLFCQDTIRRSSPKTVVGEDGDEEIIFVEEPDDEERLGLRLDQFDRYRTEAVRRKLAAMEENS